jgi:hypothetical protein
MHCRFAGQRRSGAGFGWKPEPEILKLWRV